MFETRHDPAEMQKCSLRLVMSFLAIFANVCYGQSGTITQCTKSGLCSCDTNLGSVDLSGLSGGDPFQTTSSQGDQYFWLPCKNFDKETEKDVGAVQYTSFMQYYTLGTNTDPNTSTNVTDGMPCFIMTDGQFMRQAEVLCACPTDSSNDATLEFQSETDGPPYHYIFKLTAPQCCPGGGSPGSSSGSISVGWILTIIFLSSLLLYFAIGFGVQTGVRKADGRDRIPNVSFWTALPGLIKDGFRFTISRGKASTTYRQI